MSNVNLARSWSLHQIDTRREELTLTLQTLQALHFSRVSSKATVAVVPDVLAGSLLRFSAATTSQLHHSITPHLAITSPTSPTLQITQHPRQIRGTSLCIFLKASTKHAPTSGDFDLDLRKKSQSMSTKLQRCLGSCTISFGRCSCRKCHGFSQF